MNFRYATKDDAAKVLFFIKELAEYEKMSDLVIATEESIRREIFENSRAEVIFALDESGVEVGFALYFYSFSTFLAKGGIHLEDLYVLPEARGKGYGKGLLLKLYAICKEKGLGRLEWTCLDWNTGGLDFYRSLGAEVMNEWVLLRMTNED